MRWILICLVCCLPPGAAAQERLVRLYAPPVLVETGLLKFILPRFSLKTRVRVEIVGDPAEADMRLGPDGRAVFQGAGAAWHIQTVTASDWTARFEDWLTSDVGTRTIYGFAPDGAALFTAPAPVETTVAAVEIGGDAALGLEVSKTQCGRCHAVDDASRMNTIGSTPSFFVLKTFDDWEFRFGAFYTLKPHAAFTQIARVTDPFPADRPSPIVPVELTLEELEAVLAYVAALEAADLGPPLDHQ